MLIDTRIIDGFEIKFYAEEEYSSVHDCFEEDESNNIQSRIDSGELKWFCANVTASKNGIALSIEYRDYCCYKSYEDFINVDDHYSDMVNTVIDQANQDIIDLCK